MPARKPRPDEKPQFERFLEAAKMVEAAETDEGLAGAIRLIAPAKRPTQTKREPTGQPIGRPK